MSKKSFKKSVYFREELNNDSFFEFLLEEFGVDEPIFIEDINIGGYSKQWLYKQLKELVDKDQISKFSRGIYYIPSIGVLGKRTLNPLKIINRKYINNGESCGFLIGTSLLNEAHLTTQVAQSISILTNNEKSRVRKIKIGNQIVTLRQSSIKINDKNIKTLKLLELMKDVDKVDFDEIEKEELFKYVKALGVTKNDVLYYVDLYPKKVLENLIRTEVINILK